MLTALFFPAAQRERLRMSALHTFSFFSVRRSWSPDNLTVLPLFHRRGVEVEVIPCKCLEADSAAFSYRTIMYLLVPSCSSHISGQIHVTLTHSIHAIHFSKQQLLCKGNTMLLQSCYGPQHPQISLRKTRWWMKERGSFMSAYSGQENRPSSNLLTGCLRGHNMPSPH